MVKLLSEKYKQAKKVTQKPQEEIQNFWGALYGSLYTEVDKHITPEYLKTNLDLEKFIVSINDAKKQDGGEGAIIIKLRNL